MIFIWVLSLPDWILKICAHDAVTFQFCSAFDSYILHCSGFIREVMSRFKIMVCLQQLERTKYRFFDTKQKFFFKIKVLYHPVIFLNNPKNKIYGIAQYDDFVLTGLKKGRAHCFLKLWNLKKKINHCTFFHFYHFDWDMFIL